MIFRIPWMPFSSENTYRKARVAYYKARATGTVNGLEVFPEPTSFCIDIEAETIAELKRKVSLTIMPTDPRPVMLASDRVLKSFRVE